MKPDLGFVTVFFLLSVVIFMSSNISYAQSKPTRELIEKAELSIGSTAFDFTLKSSNNENIRLYEQRGNIVLINFWASWSGSSTRLLSQFETLYQEHKEDNFTVLSINIDPDTAQSVLTKQNPEHFVLFDDNKRISQLYNITTVPTIYLIDQGGKVVLTLEGFDPRYHDIIENRLEKLLSLN